MALTLHHDFKRDRSLTPRVGPALACTRALDTATRHNESGLIELVAANQPRFEHDSAGNSLGLLVEPSRTNLALYSGDLSNAAWVVSNVTKGSDSVTDPMGNANTAVRLTSTAGNGTCLQTVTSASASRSYGVYMKRVTGTGNIDLTLDGGSTWTTVTLSSSWEYFDIAQASVTNPQFGVRIVDSGDAIDFWGSQLESATSPTSLIPTTSTSVTRNSDSLLTSDVSWVNAAAGSIFAAISKPYCLVVLNGTIFCLSDGTTAGRIMVDSTSAVNMGLYVGVSAVTQCDLNNADMDFSTDGVVHAMASYSANDFELYVEGARTGTGDQSGSIPTVDRLNIGSAQTGTNLVLSAIIEEIRYYDERLDDATLAAYSLGQFGGGDAVTSIMRRRRGR